MAVGTSLASERARLPPSHGGIATAFHTTDSPLPRRYSEPSPCIRCCLLRGTGWLVGRQAGEARTQVSERTAQSVSQ